MKKISKIQHNDALHQMMKAWRNAFHQCPETSFTEFKTAAKIAELLRSFKGMEVHTDIAVTGVVGVLKGSLQDVTNSRSIGLRADIDALDITEENDFSYRSTIEGKMHACGHDGHTAMLLGAAKHLSDNPHFAGQVVFIFQPAEEGGGGGERMCQEGLFERFPCDSVYGLHNWPGLPVGEFAVHSKAVMAATESFNIEITGKGCHAAMPNLGVDTIVVASQCVQSLQTIVSRNVAPTNTAVVSVTQFHAGSAFNIIPEKAFLNGTIRSFKPEVNTQLKDAMTKLVQHTCNAMGATGNIEFHDSYPATINHPEYAQICADIAIDLVGKQNVRLDEPPSMGAEDFSFMLNEKPGAYIWIGNGDSASLHHPKYDFNDDILPIGANYWVALVSHLTGLEQ